MMTCRTEGDAAMRKTVALFVAAALGVAALTGGAFLAGRSSVDQTLYCGAFTQKWDGMNGCEILPGYRVVPQR
jgi:hypothetical protein